MNGTDSSNGGADGTRTRNTHQQRPSRALPTIPLLHPDCKCASLLGPHWLFWCIRELIGQTFVTCWPFGLPVPLTGALAFVRWQPQPNYSNPYRAMRKALSRVCHRLNGALCLGMVTLCVAHQPMPRINVKVPDVLQSAMWAGCKSQGIKRLKAHLIGPGWNVP